jgi:hypothetical protein
VVSGPEDVQTRDAWPDPLVVDLYKTAVEMADRLSGRRATANAFFLSVESAFIAVVGVANGSLVKQPWWVSVAVAVAGIAISASWWLQLRSYRMLNTAKFVVINRIETQSLPVHIFADEWQEMQRRSTSRWRARYVEMGTLERIIPVVFAAIYVLLLIGQIAD